MPLGTPFINGGYKLTDVLVAVAAAVGQDMAMQCLRLDQRLGDMESSSQQHDMNTWHTVMHPLTKPCLCLQGHAVRQQQPTEAWPWPSMGFPDTSACTRLVLW